MDRLTEIEILKDNLKATQEELMTAYKRIGELTKHNSPNKEVVKQKVLLQEIKNDIEKLHTEVADKITSYMDSIPDIIDSKTTKKIIK